MDITGRFFDVSDLIRKQLFFTRVIPHKILLLVFKYLCMFVRCPLESEQ